jgi:hypothetical protein
MTLEEFDKGMRRIEAVFNRGKELQGDARGEYIEALRYLEAPVFDAAVTMVIETFKPWKEEPFPSPFTIQDAVTMAQSEDAIFGPRRERGAPNSSAADFCQLCENRGLYLADDGMAHFCRCEKGRIKRASWDIPYGARKRDARIEEALDNLSPSKGPVRGLMEKNALGFWEPNMVEHERRMEGKREQVRRLEAREAEKQTRKSDRLPRTIDREELRRAVAETRALTLTRRNESAEASQEEEEEQVPF